MCKNISIIGAGEGGSALIDVLRDDPSLNIMGVCDINAGALGIQKARNLNIPTFSNYEDIVKKETDIIIDVTNNIKFHEKLQQHIKSSTNLRHIEVINGASAKLLWKLISSKENRKKIIEALYEMAVKLFSRETREISDVFFSVVKNAVSISKAIRCDIYLIDQSGEYISLKATTDPYLEKKMNEGNAHIYLRGDGLTGWVFKTGKPLCINNLEKFKTKYNNDIELSDEDLKEISDGSRINDEDRKIKWNDSDQQAKCCNTTCYVAVPIFSFFNEVQGVIRISYADNQGKTEPNIKILEHLSLLNSISLDNERESRRKDLLIKIGAIFDKDELFNFIVTEVPKLIIGAGCSIFIKKPFEEKIVLTYTSSKYLYPYSEASRERIEYHLTDGKTGFVAKYQRTLMINYYGEGNISKEKLEIDYKKLEVNSNYSVKKLLNGGGAPVALLAIIKKDSNSQFLEEEHEYLSTLIPQSQFVKASSRHPELCETGPNAKPYSFLALPIMNEHNILIGVIRIPRHENTGVFTKDDIKLIESITDRISTILEKENYLKANLNTLAEINHQINSSTKIEDILNSILVAVTDNLGFSFSSIHLVDEAKGVIRTEKERFKTNTSKVYKLDELGKEIVIHNSDSLDRKVEVSKFDSKTRKLLLAHNILLPYGTKKYAYFSNAFLDEASIKQAIEYAKIGDEFHEDILFLWRNSHIDIKSWVLSILKEAIVVTGDSPRLNHSDNKHMFQYLTRCFVPILSIQNRIGVLEAGQDIMESGVISNSKIELLKALSNQAAIAINNSNLQKITKTQLKDKTYEVNILDDVGKIISSADSLDSILNVIYTNISEALKKRESPGVNIGIFLYEESTHSLELYQPFSLNTNPPPY